MPAATSLVRSHLSTSPCQAALTPARGAFAGRCLHLISRALQRLHSLDGTLGWAAALVDLHHTSFSAESALLPSGAVTPVGGQYNLGADLGHLPEAGAPSWSVEAPQGQLAAGQGAQGDAEMQMWLDNEVLGHSFEGWFDLPLLASPAGTGSVGAP